MKIPGRLILATLAVLATAAVAADSIGVKVYDKGSDGNERFYDIRCPDDRSIMVVHRFQDHKVCFFLPDGEEFCVKTDDLDAAGQRACGMR